MPCIKCSNGKWRYGEHGRCQFKTLEACRRAEQAIHAKPKIQEKTKAEHYDHECSCQKNKESP